jgi:GT2 family glycosyltransferase
LSPKVGIVVPTLGERPDYLLKCLESIRAGGEAFVVLVAPATFDPSPLKSSGLIDLFVADPKSGLPQAINSGFKALPATTELINWLGDDDLLTPGSLMKTSRALEADRGLHLVFGSCHYVDPEGDVIWTNRSGPWAVPLLRFGPDLIPQPGALFRRSSFEEVGGLDSKFGWAFDFDLFIKLSKLGKAKFLNEPLASFRWHPESLSVEFRKKSVAEASSVRISHLPKALRPIAFIWEWPVRQATLFAGGRVTATARRKQALK